jgi:hypothetical protein
MQQKLCPGRSAKEKDSGTSGQPLANSFAFAKDEESE